MLHLRAPRPRAFLLALSVAPLPGTLQAPLGPRPPAAVGPANGSGSPPAEAKAACTPVWVPTFGSEAGVDGPVFALATYDDGGGPAIFAAGEFTSAGALPLNGVARWDGTSWSLLGSGVPGSHESIPALAVFHDGTGPALYIGGGFLDAGGVAPYGVARWDGSSWSPVGGLLGVKSLAVFDGGAGEELYAAVQPAGACDPWGCGGDSLFRWNGSTWILSGYFYDPFFGGSVEALEVFDDGGGPALYAGGDFVGVDGVAAKGIARWDGAQWLPLGSGVSGTVHALEVFDDGTGPALYVGGLFASAGGVAANSIAKWDGSSWSSLSSGVTGGYGVSALGVFDDGAGLALYVGGDFTTAGGASASHVARWDGSSWSPLGSGMSLASPAWPPEVVRSFAVFDDGNGEALYAGGTFPSAIDSGDGFLAKWGCPPSIIHVPGCSGNPAVLSALSGAAKIGQLVSVKVTAAGSSSGISVLFAGADGTDAEGCGLHLAGFGEILLAPLSPVPLAIAQEGFTGGVAVHQLIVPADPALVGAEVLLQAASGPPVELSTGLALAITP